MFRIFLSAVALATLSGGTVFAQEVEEQGRGVARVSLISGDVSVRRGDTNEWVAAAINAPLLSEDRVLTGAGSRTELQFDSSNFARLSSGAELRLADIENRRFLVRLAVGTMTWRVLRDRDAEVEISTPNISVRPMKKGVYRVSVLGDGTTEVTVRSGEAEIFTPQGTERLKSGKTLMARGTAADPEFRTSEAISMDDFDRWNQSRDRDLERSESYRNVSRDIYGSEDMDGHGRWLNSPEYGQVWAPTTSVGWAPYRNGRWSWIDYYGWSWVSYDPWGWAPYHYGRWYNQVGVGWCWWPGRSNARHYWSPALVGFFGWGGGGVGVGFGNWGWVPLAPFETYDRWYGNRHYGGYRNGNFGNNVNITNINVTNVYRNARNDNGVTVINGRDFGRGSVNHIRYDRNELNNASFVRGQVPMTPDRESTRWSDRAATSQPGAGRGDDRFFSRGQPSRIDRVPFENQQTAMREVSRRTFDSGTGNRTPTEARGGTPGGGGNIMERGGARAEQPAERRGDAVRGGADASGWRRLGENGTRADAPSNQTDRIRGGADTSRGTVTRGESNRGGDTGGWRRFGDASSPRTDTGSTGGATTRGDVNRGGSTTRGNDTGWGRFGTTRADDAGSRNQTIPDRGTRSGDSNRSTERQTIPDRGSRSGDADRSTERQTIPDRGSRGGDFGRSAEQQTIPDRGSRGGDFGRSTERQTIPDRGSRSGDSGRSVERQTIPDRGSRGGDSGGSRMGGPVIRERSSDGGGSGGGGGGNSSPAPRGGDAGGGSSPRGGGGRNK